MVQLGSWVVVIASIMALPQAAIAGSAIPSVLVTVAPLQPIADALLAGITKSTSLTHANQDPHSMALSPSQARALDKANIIVTPDRDMHPALEKIFERREKAGALIISLTALNGADALPYSSHQAWLGDEEEKHDDHDNEMLDPHLWMDPIRMAAIAVPLANAMGKQAPSQHATLLANARLLSQHLRDEVNPAMRKLLGTARAPSKFKNRPFVPFITGHSAYQYFLARYNINDPGALITRPEEYLGARSMRDVLKRSDEIAIGCIIAESDAGWTKKVATATGATVVIVNPEQLPAREGMPVLGWIDNDYDRLLYDTAKKIGGCL